jgi:glycosyltransferase involved in cell wall biosynthesis
LKRKGIRELTESIRLALKRNSNLKFIIAGTGLLENVIREFIDKNNLSHAVRLITDPERNEIIKLFKVCDAFILPSRLDRLE